jgi:hypothetical protein
MDVVAEGGEGTVQFCFDTPRGGNKLDGKYVGNTPSAIGLSSGAHVVLSMPGFIVWKRALTVLAGSE